MVRFLLVHPVHIHTAPSVDTKFTSNNNIIKSGRFEPVLSSFFLLMRIFPTFRDEMFHGSQAISFKRGSIHWRVWLVLIALFDRLHVLLEYI